MIVTNLPFYPTISRMTKSFDFKKKHDTRKCKHWRAVNNYSQAPKPSVLSDVFGEQRCRFKKKNL